MFSGGDNFDENARFRLLYGGTDLAKHTLQVESRVSVKHPDGCHDVRPANRTCVANACIRSTRSIRNTCPDVVTASHLRI